MFHIEIENSGSSTVKGQSHSHCQHLLVSNTSLSYTVTPIHYTRQGWSLSGVFEH